MAVLSPEEFMAVVSKSGVPPIPFPTLVGRTVPTAILSEDKVWILKKDIVLDWDKVTKEDWAEIYEMYSSGRYKFVKKSELWEVPGARPMRKTRIFCYELSSLPKQDLEEVQIAIPMVLEKEIRSPLEHTWENVKYVLEHVVEGDYKGDLREDQIVESYASKFVTKEGWKRWSAVYTPEKGWTLHFDD
jgi:hypothetical protein